MTHIQMKNLSVGYNRHPVVSGIDIDIQKGEIIALIGPNGAGKSTILKTISGNLDAVGGNVFIDRKELGEYTYSELSRKMAVILTERSKTELMTCRDVVEMGRYPYTGRLGFLSGQDIQKVDEALKIVHAEDIENKDFNKISDGQKQRILLARAICQEPEIILLDEPTSFLDVKHKLELLTILAQMARKSNITVIMSLHEIDLAEKVADRIITVKDGRISGCGRPESIFKEDSIRQLYDIEKGFFDPLFGSIELPEPSGENPEVFVIAGGGSGIPVFRALQKKNISFAAGILYKNDVDHALARLLAKTVVTEEPFAEIGEKKIEEAMRVMDGCRYVVDAGCTFGKMNQRMEQLVDAARQSGKLTEPDKY